MKKKMPLWLNLIFSLLACAVCLGTVATLEYLTEVMSETVKTERIVELVSRRADTMNGYFAGEVEFMHASEQLHDVEMGELLEDDLWNLQAYERTDIEVIQNYEIRDVILLNEDENNVSARVTVEWIVYGIDGMDQFTSTYEVSCEKQGETLKLVEFF